MKSIFYKFIISFFTCNCGLFFSLFSQDKSVDFDEKLSDKLSVNIQKGLQFLEYSQQKFDIITFQKGKTFKGEWETNMGLKKAFFLLGTKNRFGDSNCFSVSSIHNDLATIYLSNPEYTQIQGMLDKSFQRIISYKNGANFNFWNLYSPNRKLKKADVIGSQPLVRRPTNYPLKTRYINQAANIMDDADDTSLGYKAIALRKQYLAINLLPDTLNIDAKFIANIFSKYRDTNRVARHWYNYVFGNDYNTGAYLTWLGKERETRWNFFKEVGHNFTFFMPFSKCYPLAYKPYMPYGSNDLDAVVNSNILSTLAIYNQLDNKGAKSAINFIEKKAKAKYFDHLGIYYPNRYHFPYSVSEAFSNGVSNLDKSAEYIIEFLLKNQANDGSWSSKRRVNKGDVLQSTAFALNALINFGDFEKYQTKLAIQKAIQYILNHSLSDKNGLHWTGGVFFSGGTVVRNHLFWKSDAYTTSIIIKAFVKYNNIFGLKNDLISLSKLEKQ